MTVCISKNRSYQSNIIFSNELKQWHLKGLLDHSIDVIRIPNYYTKENSSDIANKLRSSEYFGSYVNAPLIGRVGQAYFECQNDELSLARYKKNALKWVRNMRQQLHPYITPIDRLRVEIGDSWIHGCNLATIDGNKLFAGLVREFKENSYAEPHNDVLAWDVTGDDSTDVTNQLSANIYLETSQEGGELVLWNEWPIQSEYNVIKIDGSYGVDRNKIMPPQIEITPQQGELILFNPMRIHSVEKIQSGSRMTWTCFIGYSNDNNPLVVWS